jgi:hypothetical protein
MSSETAKRRLAKLEGALSPRAAVLLWLAEAHAFPTLPAYASSLLGRPDAELPPKVIGARVEAAARVELRGLSPEAIKEEVRKRLRNALFLLELVLKINLETLARVELEELRLAVFTYQARCLQLEAEIPEYRDFPYGGRSLAERWGEWREDATAFIGGLYAAEEARLLLERRDLESRACLFPELASEWESLLERAEGLAGVYGLMSAEPGQEATKRGSRQARSGLIDLDAVRAAARAEAPARAADLTEQARCATLDILDDGNAADSILERRVRRLLDE